jgi:hypothetical protein
MATKWPKEVPVLTPEEICRGPYQKGECGCLAFHEHRMFGHGGVASDAHSDAMTKALPEEFDTPYFDFNVETPVEEQAALFNRATATIGYELSGSKFVYVGKGKPKARKRRT